MLKQDKREVFRAAADAQRAADWCLARHPDYASKMEAAAAAETREHQRSEKPRVAAADPASAAPRARSGGPRPISEAMPEHLKRRLGMTATEPTTPPMSDAAPAPAAAPAPW